MASREDLLVCTVVELADSLVEDFDVVDLLALLTDRCIEIFGLTAAGIVLSAPAGDLQVMASSSEEMRLLELFEVQTEDGPCLECVRHGGQVVNVALIEAKERWPDFSPRALAAGFRTVHALPMRHRGEIVGALNLFDEAYRVISDADVVVAQALTDVATISLLQHRTKAEVVQLNDQLTHALSSRVSIEQAKGVLAEQAGLDMDGAFEMLRSHARGQSRRLVDVAADVIAGQATASSISSDR